MNAALRIALGVALALATACHGSDPFGTSCTPSCAGRACGDDGCGASCGSCAAGSSCQASGVCALDPADAAALDAGSSDAASDGGAPKDAGIRDGGAIDAGSRDAGSSDAGTGSDAGAVGLYTQGNHLYTLDGKIWHGRGANIHDPRSCNACTSQPPDVGEVERRVDELVDRWHANFLRLDLESYAADDGYRNAANYKSALQDPAYLDQIRQIVQYVGTKPGVYVLVSVWIDPTTSAQGWPTLGTAGTPGTDTLWTALAQKLADQPQALFGIINEPQSNDNGAQDATVWSLMSAVIKAIRDVEDQAGVPYHIITAQGTGGWARRLDYYVTHPITERAGKNVAYEVHVYNPTADFPTLFENAAKTIPVVIGEFGPDGTYMQLADCTALMDRAQALEIPHLAWTFHMRCPPSLLVDNSGGACGAGMTLAATDWGNLLKARLATSW